MMIRALRATDIEKLREIHERYYIEEFEFPEFFQHFLNTFVIVDDNNRIITGGGVRTITESVLITDKSFSVKDRREALLGALQASLFTCAAEGYNQLHAFIIESHDWENQLKKHNFQECRGKAIYIGDIWLRVTQSEFKTK